jgi:xanthine dehydrogenase accessory factor
MITNICNLKILIKGAGEMATGVAHRLHQANLRRIVMTEVPEPLTVRRTVAFSEAVFQGVAEVEGVTADLMKTFDEYSAVWERGHIGVFVDPQWTVTDLFKPDVVVDLIMAKRNLGTTRSEAALVIGVGPGFAAPEDVHVVIESNRGHDLGRVIYQGSAEPYTGTPGLMEVPGTNTGYTKERVLRSPRGGLVKHAGQIGDFVQKGDLVLYVNDTPVYATIDGMLRGLIREIIVNQGEKVGDIDPRGKKEYCFTITEKARAIGGGVLEAIMHELNR